MSFLPEVGMQIVGNLDEVQAEAMMVGSQGADICMGHTSAGALCATNRIADPLSLT